MSSVLSLCPPELFVVKCTDLAATRSSVDGSRPFMPNGFGFDPGNPGNIVQSPYTISNVQNIQRNVSGPQGGMNSNHNSNNGGGNNGTNNSHRASGPLDMSIPTSALLPNSAFPTSSAFASSSRMNFGQDTVRSAQGNISGNGNFQGQIDENAFASSASDNMASNTAASLIASNGLGSLVNPGTLATQTPAGPNMPGLYSTTGFDIVSVLAKVANRKDPKTVLGPIDCSCSFVVSVCIFNGSASSWFRFTDPLPIRTGCAKVRFSHCLYVTDLFPIDRIRGEGNLGPQLSVLAESRWRGRQGVEKKVHR